MTPKRHFEFNWPLDEKSGLKFRGWKFWEWSIGLQISELEYPETLDMTFKVCGSSYYFRL
jgi:hypothetical protein